MSKEVKVKVYTIDELSEEARDRALSDWNANSPYVYADDARSTIEAMEMCLGISCGRWSYDSCRSDYSITYHHDDEVLELKGNRARAWFWNNIAPDIFKPRTIWSKTLSVGCKRRESRMSVSCECPWTGMCFDMDALDPVLKFMLGQDRDETKTVRDVIKAAVSSLFDALVADCEYQQSMEAFVESCKANGYTFLGSGKMVNW